MELHFWASAIIDFFSLHVVIILAYDLHMPGIKSNGKLYGSRNHLPFAEHCNFEFIRSFPPIGTQYTTPQKSGEEIEEKGSDEQNVRADRVLPL